MDDMITFTNSRRNDKRSGKFVTFLKRNWGQIFVIISLIILAVLVLYPLFILLIRSIKFPADDMKDPFGFPTRITFENYIAIWDYIKDAYINSFVTTIGVTAGTVVLSSLLAFSFVRFNFPFKRFFYYMIISLMMVPAILTLITRYQQIVSMGLTNSFSGVILPGIAGYIPSSFILLFTFFAGLPKDLFEAAEVDGANDAKTYVKIVAPLSSPILWTIGIQTFVGQWNDYLWSKLVMTDDTWKTLPVYLTDLTEDLAATTGYAVPFAGYVLSSIPLIVIFIAASKQFISGMTSGAFKM